MTVPAADSLRNLESEHPEWKPWLAVVQEVIREANDRQWERFVPESAERQPPGVPLLSGATLNITEPLIRRWGKKLIATAAQSGAPNMAPFGAITERSCNHLELFRSSLCHDTSAIEFMADELGVERQAFKALAVLFAVPFLNACSRMLSSSVNQSWTEGYCPICGAWPAFAEVRGIERSRYFRCGRCAAAWEARCLLCPFCGMDDHEELGSLVPEKSDGMGTIEICRRCFGYTKIFTLLQTTPCDEVMLRDLASVALDVAALNEDYKRPEGLGYAITIGIAPVPTLTERILSWRT